MGYYLDLTLKKCKHGFCLTWVGEEYFGYLIVTSLLSCHGCHGTQRNGLCLSFSSIEVPFTTRPPSLAFNHLLLTCYYTYASTKGGVENWTHELVPDIRLRSKVEGFVVNSSITCTCFVTKLAIY